MKEKEFTFIKLETGGRLRLQAKSERAARERKHLDPELWRLEGKAEPEGSQPGAEPDNLGVAP